MLKASRKMLTVLKSHMNATNATMHLPIKAIWTEGQNSVTLLAESRSLMVIFAIEYWVLGIFYKIPVTVTAIA